MTTGPDNSNARFPIDDREMEARLRAIEHERSSADHAIEAMRRDRAALRAALATDLVQPIPARRVAEFSNAVRDEIDRRLLADLSRGAAIDYQPSIPISTASRSGSHIPGAWWAGKAKPLVALAATIAIVGGVAWLAMFRPGSGGTSIGQVASGAEKATRTLPSWAILPERAPGAAQGPDIASVPFRASPTESDVAIEPMTTRDAATALAWARKGVLAVRITTDSPRRDRERLDTFAQRDLRESRWALSASAPSGASVIPSNPWPIDTRLADSNDSSVLPATPPSTASLAMFGLTVRPTVEAIDAARSELEQVLAGAVVFERVEGLAEFLEAPQSEPAPDSAMDVIWWKKPASQWSPRLRVPVLLEFGTPVRTPAKPGR